MTHLPRFALAAIALTVFASVAPERAEAGRPYWCSCQGKPQRNVAGTHACEILRPNHPKGAPRSFSYFRKHPCSTQEYAAWHRNACADSKCTATAMPARKP